MRVNVSLSEISSLHTRNTAYFIIINEVFEAFPYLAVCQRLP